MDLSLLWATSVRLNSAVRSSIIVFLLTTTDALSVAGPCNRYLPSTIEVSLLVLSLILTQSFPDEKNTWPEINKSCFLVFLKLKSLQLAQYDAIAVRLKWTTCDAIGTKPTPLPP